MSDEAFEIMAIAAFLVIGIPLVIWDIRRRWKSGRTDYFSGDGGD